MTVRVGEHFREIFDEARRHDDWWVENIRLDFVDLLVRHMEEKGLDFKDAARLSGFSEKRIMGMMDTAPLKLEDMVHLARAVGMEGIRIEVSFRDLEDPGHTAI